MKVNDSPSLPSGTCSLVKNEWSSLGNLYKYDDHSYQPVHTRFSPGGALPTEEHSSANKMMLE